MKRRERRFTPGLPPGTLPEVVDAAEVRPQIVVHDYSAQSLETRTTDVVATDIAQVPDGTVRWVRISGPPDSASLTALGSALGIHPLVLEDIASTEQRIKTEEYDAFTFTVTRTLHVDGGNGDSPELRDSEVDLVLADRVLVTVDDGSQPVLFEPILKRLGNPGSLLRRSGADLLYYAVIDLVVDRCFPVVATYEDEIDMLEESISSNPNEEHIGRIHRLRSELRRFRSVLWSTRDVTAAIERSGAHGMADQTQFYFRDTHDHVMHVLELVSDLKESAGALRELHGSGMSNRMNEVMKVLTIIATIFIPVTFVAGVYGMNFTNMPELGYRWAYPAVLGLMLAIAGGMLIFFRRRKWL